MTEKPIITIDNFTGSGINGILYCKGLYPEVDNGKSVMSEGYYTSKIVDTSTSGYSNLGTVNAILKLSSVQTQDTIYNIFYDGLKFHAYSIYTDSILGGVLHTSAGLIQKADLMEDVNGNILYSQQNYIGLGIRGKATGGSTTTLIDTTRHFGGVYKGAYDNGTTYAQYEYVYYNGLWYACLQASTGNLPTNATYWIETTPNTIAVNDKVTNLKTGIEYTITSISKTTNQNDTLNFTASGTNTNVANAEYIAWENDKHNITMTKSVWQESTSYWSKQFKQLGIQYLFTNGNYIGAISSDSEVCDKTFKQLPNKYQALAMDVNVDQLLVSCNYRGKGAFLLWDGSRDDWNNVVEFDRPVEAIVKYNTGWVFVSSGTVYFTNGYQLQKMYSINSTKKVNRSFNSVGFNALYVYEEMLYCGNIFYDVNFIEKGIYAIDLSNVSSGFTLIKCLKTTKDNGTPYCITDSNLFNSYSNVMVGGDGFVDYLYYGNSGGSKRDKSVIISIALPKEIQVKGIGLNLGRYLKDYNNDINTTRSRMVQVSVGDGKRGLMDYAYTTATGYYGTSMVMSGTNVFANTEVGDELINYESDYYGDRAFITAITGKGESGETWTIDTAVSSTSNTSSNFNLLRVRKFGKKTIENNVLNQEILFTEGTGIRSNKIFIEIVFFGQANAMPLNINHINIYGE